MLTRLSSPATTYEAAVLCLRLQQAAYRGIACREVQDVPRSLGTSTSWALTSSTSLCSSRPTQVGWHADLTLQAVMNGTSCAVLQPPTMPHECKLMPSDHAACQSPALQLRP